jgi:DNA polymerase
MYKKIYQKDVNNYLIVDMEGKVKSKGAYVKKLSDLDYDLPIVNRAIIEYMVNGTSVEQTICACDELRSFQKIVKVSGKYLYALHGETILNDKTLRVFASSDPKAGSVSKLKAKGKNPEKFANTPDRCFIDNGDIIGKKIPAYLDRRWYIDLTNERLSQFGVR